jgi:hypothetical protein
VFGGAPETMITVFDRSRRKSTADEKNRLLEAAGKLNCAEDAVLPVSDGSLDSRSAPQSRTEDFL